MTLAIVLIVLVLIAVFIAMQAYNMSRKRGVPPALAGKLAVAFAAARSQADTHRRVLEGEKVLDAALQSLGYQGSMADKLRKAGPRFANLQSVWDAHKLRNRVAHEMNVPLDVREADRAMEAFAKALRSLGVEAR